MPQEDDTQSGRPTPAPTAMLTPGPASMRIRDAAKSDSEQEMFKLPALPTRTSATKRGRAFSSTASSEEDPGWRPTRAGRAYRRHKSIKRAEDRSTQSVADPVNLPTDDDERTPPVEMVATPPTVTDSDPVEPTTPTPGMSTWRQSTMMGESSDTDLNAVNRCCEPPMLRLTVVS